jgi:transcriptional regulator with XRE-family HTH domain
VARVYEDIIAVRLAQLRTQKGVSARDMSLSLGQSINYINMIENKKTYPSMTVFFYICEYLGVTPQEFFESENGNPELLGRVIADLKRLDDRTMISVADIVKGLVEKER